MMHTLWNFQLLLASPPIRSNRDHFQHDDFPLLVPSQNRLLPVTDEVDMICGQANAAAIERPVRHNSTLPMAEGPYAKCWLSCIAGLA